MKKKKNSKITNNNSVVMVIDIQEKLLPVIENKEEVLSNTKLLLKASKVLGIKTIITEQYPKGLGNTVAEINTNDSKVIEKTSFSVCVDHKKKIDKLIKKGKTKFIIAGIETHVCVFQTVRDLLAKGVEVYLLSDAVGSRKSINSIQAIGTLRKMGATVVPTETVLFDILKTSNHKKFKDISRLIK